MSLYRKLGLFILGATVLPLVIVGLLVLRTAEDALRVRIVEAQRQAASAEAARVARFVQDTTSALQRSAAFFDLASATSEQERANVLHALYQAHDAVSVALLVDEAGAPLAPAAFIAPTDDPGALGQHPRVTEASAQRLAAVAPLERAVKEGRNSIVLSPVYGASERRETAFAVALAKQGPGGKLAVFLAEVALGSLTRRHGAGEIALTLVDGEGRVVAAADSARLTAVDARVQALGVNGVKGVRDADGANDVAGATSVTSADGAELVAFASVPVEGIGWTVLASLSEEDAFAPVRRMRATLGAALAAVIALLLIASAFFVRSVRRGVSAVVDGAERFAQGKLDHKIVPPAERELAHLAGTFNRMGDELFNARKKLETWNEELERTVDIRTRELREAQAKLLETSKLAAVGQLGAGVAHEINNPLSTVLGSAQNMLIKKRKGGAAEDDPELVTLGKIERAAKRCRDITTTLLRFSQRSDEQKRAPVALNAIVEDAVSMTRAHVEGDGTALKIEVTEPSPMVLGDRGDLVQVVVHLVNNAKTALKDRPKEAPGTITIATVRDGEGVRLRVKDDGKGIDPAIRARIFEPFFTTKDVWTNLGLGLSESFRIVEDHRGRFVVESEVGGGTTMDVVLPQAPEGARG